VVGYVHDVLIPRAQRDEITIIAARGVKHWGLPKHKKNIVLYEGAETRSAHLTLNSRKAIARRLGL
jgi:hypothetical protein